MGACVHIFFFLTSSMTILFVYSYIPSIYTYIYLSPFTGISITLLVSGDDEYGGRRAPQVLSLLALLVPKYKY